MTLKLDDFLTKKKEPAQILDLSKATATSRDELKRLLEKVPEYKIKPEKVKAEEIKIREKDFNFKATKKELKPKREYAFQNPTPVDMRSMRMEDLSSVNIPWKMLTSLRPKTKLDEEFYSRLVELGRLALKTRLREKKIRDADFIRKMKNRAGILETRILSCKECYEEFCTGEACSEFLYESYQRETKGPIITADKSGQMTEKQERGRSKKKRGSKKKKRPKSTKSLDRGKRRVKRESPQRRSKSLDKHKFLKHMSSTDSQNKSLERVKFPKSRTKSKNMDQSKKSTKIKLKKKVTILNIKTS